SRPPGREQPARRGRRRRRRPSLRARSRTGDARASRSATARRRPPKGPRPRFPPRPPGSGVPLGRRPAAFAPPPSVFEPPIARVKPPPTIASENGEPRARARGTLAVDGVGCDRLRPRACGTRRPVRWALLHRRALDGNLLPTDLSFSDRAPRERALLPHGRRG